MAYSDFATKMIAWYDDIIAYAKGEKAHVNLKIEINPLTEVNNVKKSAYAKDVIIMQNAAEEQVAVQRAVNEIDASPEYYQKEWLAFLTWEQEQIVSFETSVTERDDFITKTSVDMQKFFHTINPDGLKNLKDYNPTSALKDERDEMNA